MTSEQARGGAVDKRADIWAFGVVLLEMLTGNSAFVGQTVSDTLAAVLRAEVDFQALPADTPAGIRRLVRRCLERDVKRRLPDIAMARIEIDDATAPEATAAQAPPVRTRGGLWPWLAAAVALLGCAALAWVHFRETPPEPVLARFNIDLPARYRVSLGMFALSPDGRKLAFSASSPQDPFKVWVRALDSTSLQPLPGTERAAFPFWSPDGRTLGFFVDRQLKRIDLATGAVEATDAGTGPGTWNREGVILFGTGPAGAINRMRAAGGESSAATTLEPAHDESYHQWPYFLPDGRHFLFMVGGRDDSGIYVGSLDSKERKRVVPFSANLIADASMAVYAEPGYLVYIRNHQLVAAPFDARRLEVKGDPVVVASSVDRHPSGLATFIASSRVLAYREAEPAPAVQMTWVDRSGRTMGTAGTAGPIEEFRLSPDGRQIAVAVNDGKEPNSIWLIDVQRGTQSRFTSGYYCMGPVWAPDGSAIVYGMARDAPPNLFRQALTAAEGERLMNSPTQNYASDWSRDGRLILYWASSPSTLADLWTMPVAGDRKATPLLQTKYRETGGRFSPEPGGPHWVAYVSNESGTNQVYVTTFPAPGRKWQISVNGGYYPAWRADGKEIYYQGPNRRVMAVAVKTEPTFEAGDPHVLFENPGSNFDVTADGQRFLVGVPAREAPPAPIIVVLNWQAGLKK